MPSTILKSQYELAPLPSPSTSVFQFLLPQNISNPDHKAFIAAESDESYTRSQLRTNALRLGAGIKSLFGPSPSPSSPGKKNVALVFSPNSIHYPLIFFALQATLTIASLANASYTPKELIHQLRDGKPTVLFVHPALWPVAQKSLQALEREPHESGWVRRVKVFFTVPARELPEENPRGIKSFESLYVDEKEVRGWDGDELGKEGDLETAVLCYSSGTTGLAKGVETTHRNLTHVSVMAKGLMIPLNPDTDKVIGVLPYFHIYGMVKLVCFPLVVGIPNVTLPKFDPLLFLKTIQTYRITWALLVPPILVVLANHPIVDEYDLSSLRSIMCGAAPLGEGLTRKAIQRLNRGKKEGEGLTISQGYGLTETTAPCMAVKVEDSVRKIGSAGKLFPGLEAKLIDLDGNAIPISFEGEGRRSKPGEFCLRGSTVMKGYWNNPKATEGTFLEDGWYRTGDIAEVDEEGFFYIVDRLKELIKYKGFQVPPADLEALLLTHPKVDDVGVIGIASEAQATELPRAYIVPQGGLARWKTQEEREGLEREIVVWVQENVANHKRLRGGVVFVDAIPKSPAGKILRRELREMAKVDGQQDSNALNTTQQKIANL